MTVSHRPLSAGGAALLAVGSLLTGIAGLGTGQPSAPSRHASHC